MGRHHHHHHHHHPPTTHTHTHTPSLSNTTPTTTQRNNRRNNQPHTLSPPTPHGNLHTPQTRKQPTNQPTNHPPAHPMPIHTHRGEPRIKRLIAVGVPFHGTYFALFALFLILWMLSTIERTGLALGLLMALLWSVVRGGVYLCMVGMVNGKRLID
jgi:hypothetical protein